MTTRTRLGHLALAVVLVAPALAVAPAAQADDRPPTTRSAPVRAQEPAALAEPDLLPSTASLMKTVKDLVAIAPRATGTPGGRKAADYVANRFRAAGLKDVHFETADSFSWKATNASLAVGGRTYSATPISHSLIAGPSTASRRSLGTKGLTAPVVDIGSSKVVPDSVKGKIVLFDLKFEMPLAVIGLLMEFLWDPNLQVLDPETLFTANPYQTSLKSVMKSLQDKGAVGAIGVLSDYFDSNRYHNEYYRQLAFTLPGFWVTKKDGARIRASLDAGTTSTMRLTTERTKVTARTVVGFLPGRSTDTLMVQSHHDSQGPGAVEDATGTASVIGLADYYGALARRKGAVPREKTLMFTTFDTHFTGYQQHMAFARKYVLEKRTKYRIVGNTTIEHIGRQAKINPDGSLRVLDQPEPSGIFENVNPLLKAKIAGAIVKNDLRGTAMLNATPLQAVGIPTDASFALIAGIPVVSLIAGPVYMYDEADTIDKVDVARMRPMTRAFGQILDAMDRTPSGSIGLLPSPIADLLTQLVLRLVP
ncbi:MAG: M28 family peptidase [Aeromicrobium erythreum]